MESKKFNRKSSRKQKTGSQDQGEPVFLAIGTIGKPHGIHGEAYFEIVTDFPERIIPGKRVFLGENHSPVIIKSIRFFQKRCLLSLSGFESREDVESIRKQVIYVSSFELAKLGINQFYHHEIIGLNVYDAEKKNLGKVIEILQTGSNDVYVVSPLDGCGKEILIPATQSVIINIDLEKSIMNVKLPDWG